MCVTGCRKTALIVAVFLASCAADVFAEDGPANARIGGFDIRMLTGERYAYPAPHGVVTVLVLWSPESLASRKSIGELDRFRVAQAASVRTIAVAMNSDEIRVRSFVQDNGFRFPVGLLLNATSRLPAENQLPVLYFMDEAGEVRATRSGLFRVRTLERGVETLLGTAGER